MFEYLVNFILDKKVKVEPRIETSDPEQEDNESDESYGHRLYSYHEEKEYDYSLLDKYEFLDDTADSLEEFVAQYSNLTDHTLYILTHSPCFSNLKVLDLRNGGSINTLMTLKTSYSKLNVASLEELYLNVNHGSRRKTYNISFLFICADGKFAKLKVLWIENFGASLKAKYEDSHGLMDGSEEEKMVDTHTAKLPASYRKLFLRGVNFPDELSQDLFDSLGS